MGPRSIGSNSHQGIGKQHAGQRGDSVVIHVKGPAEQCKAIRLNTKICRHQHHKGLQSSYVRVFEGNCAPSSDEILFLVK